MYIEMNKNKNIIGSYIICFISLYLFHNIQIEKNKMMEKEVNQREFVCSWTRSSYSYSLEMDLILILGTPKIAFIENKNAIQSNQRFVIIGSPYDLIINLLLYKTPKIIHSILFYPGLEKTIAALLSYIRRLFAPREAWGRVRGLPLIAEAP